MLYHKSRTFKHSGDRGDLVYALPVIRFLGGGKLYLWDNNPDRSWLEDGTLSLFTKEKIDSILPLLREQPYIKDADFWRGESIDFNLDQFRRIDLRNMNLSDVQLNVFSVPLEERNRAWITVEPKHVSPIIIARSLRYHNNSFDWHAVYQFAKGRCSFVGTPEEHAVFENLVGPIRYYATPSLLEAAQAIAGCKIFIGNQSCPYAIAEGLKKATIQETDAGCPNCVFPRQNAIYLSHHVDLQWLREWESGLC